METQYRQDKEYMEIVSDILESDVFQSTENFIMHGTTTCMEHCIDVSYMTYKIARAKGLRYQEAARGALLHDLFLYDWHTQGNRIHGFTHQVWNKSRFYTSLHLPLDNINNYKYILYNSSVPEEQKNSV